MRFSRFFFSLMLILVASAAALAQNFNSSNASASTRGSNTILMIGVGAVMLVAGGVIGYTMGRNRKG